MHRLHRSARKGDECGKLVQPCVVPEAPRDDGPQRAEKGAKRGEHRWRVKAELHVVAMAATQHVAKTCQGWQLWPLTQLTQRVLQRVIDKVAQFRRQIGAK